MVNATYIKIGSLDVSVVRPLKYYSTLRLLATLLLHISGLPYSVTLLDVVCFLTEWFPQHYHSDYIYPHILKGVTFPDITRPPQVTYLSSIPCRPHTPWCDEWTSNAFASIVQARPFLIFGWPVHNFLLQPGISPQALQTSPHGERPALRLR